MTPDQFRADFPEFANTTKYPDSMVNLWLKVSTSLVNSARWEELTDIGIELLTAHHLTIASRDATAGAAGGSGGGISGPVASKSVDKVSVSYNTAATMYEGEAFFNMTGYGIRYLSMARMFGAGGVQL
jgi:hypothetical protein